MRLGIYEVAKRPARPGAREPALHDPRVSAYINGRDPPSAAFGPGIGRVEPVGSLEMDTSGAVA